MTLREWYANREILLTGVTSELGRNLLEKLLRTFPDVKVNLIVRTRDNLTKDDRVKKIFGSPGYERLREEDPDAISRVTVYEGNLIYDDLGLTTVEIERMKNDISVVFHATGPHDAIYQFSEELPKLEAMAATSTIFRHRGRINERLQNEHKPNVPLALIRLALLGPPLREPIQGHVEILKGTTALMLGAGYVLGDSQKSAEFTPVDIATNTLIAAAWERAQRPKDVGAVVYNTATIGCTWGDLIAKGKRAARKFPYPTFGIRGITTIAWLHWAVVLFLEWLPSILCDTIVSLCGGKQRIVKEHERVRKALKSVESIAWRSWSAERNRIYVLHQRLSQEDQRTFPLIVDADIENYILSTAASTRKHCVGESTLSLVRNIRLFFIVVILTLLFSYTFIYVKYLLIN